MRGAHAGLLSETELVLLNLGEDQVELLVLLPVLVRVQGAGVDQVVQQLGVAARQKLPALALAVHPLGFKAGKEETKQLQGPKVRPRSL